MGYRRRQINSDNNCNREGVFIKKLLNQITGSTSRITVKTVQILTSIIRDLTIRIVKEAFNLCEINKKKTLTPRDIQTSVRLNLNGDLTKQAVSYALKSVTSTSEGSNTGLFALKPAYFKNKVKKMNYNYRLSKTSMVYLASVIEYLLLEILELANNSARSNNKSMVTPRDLLLAIKNDEELSIVFNNNIIIPSAGYFSVFSNYCLFDTKSSPSPSSPSSPSSATGFGFGSSTGSISSSSFGSTPVATTGFSFGSTPAASTGFNFGKSAAATGFGKYVGRNTKPSKRAESEDEDESEEEDY